MPIERDRLGFHVERLKLPEGLTREKFREAQHLIDQWQETGYSDSDLIIRIFLLFKESRSGL